MARPCETYNAHVMSSLINILNDPKSAESRQETVSPDGNVVVLGSSPVSDDAPRIKRRRCRIPLSCNVCRYRKLKCDRQQPCGSCVALKLTQACQYQAGPDKVPRVSKPGKPRPDINRRLLSDVDLSARVALLEDHLARLDGVGLVRVNNGQPQTRPIVSYANVGANYNPLIEIGQSNQNRADPMTKFDVLIKPAIKFSPDRIRYFGPSSAQGFNIEKPGPLLSIAKLAVASENLHCCGNGLSIRKSPEIIAKEQEITELIEKLSKGEPLWTEVFKLLPPRDLRDFLVERFFSTTNIIYHGLTTADFTETVDYVYGLFERWSHKPGLKLDKTEIHRLCLVVLILQLARLTFGENWKPSDSTGKPKHDECYLGHKLRLIPLAAVAITKVRYESNLVYVQLLYYMNVYLQSTLGEGDGRGNYMCTVLSASLIQAATAIGLHRDPDNFPEIPCKYFELWRLLWKQVVYFDTLQAMVLATPPMINLKYSDTQLTPSSSGYTEVNSDLDVLVLEWCLLVRRFLDEFLLVPSTKVDSVTVSQLNEAINSLESTHLIPFDTILHQIQVPVLMEANTESRYAFHLLLYLELMHLRLVLVQACSIADQVELVKIALRVLDVNKLVIDNRSRFPRFHSFLVNLSIRANNKAWKTVIWFVLAGLQNKLLLNNHQSQESISAEELKVVQELDLTGLLRASVDSFKWMNNLSQVSYAVWKDNFIMSNVLSHLSELITVAKTNSNASFLKDWESIVQEADLGIDSLVPPEKEWFDWISSEYESLNM